MSLYHIQDSDRPMWVLAENFNEAIQKWRALINEENPDLERDEIWEPDGVHFVADDNEIINT